MAACAAGGPVRADPPPNPGPDVIVGDLPDCNSYGTVGSTGIYAYDLGTTSCNAGNVNLRWQAATPLHPVIATNVYRYSVVNGAGRLEQIGMAWAKHGFFAFGQSYCAVCTTQSMNGSVLGVGCSDPYDNGLNGEQTSLGPRSEINASTGVFPFTLPHNWPPVVDGLSRRLQIAASDVAGPPAAGAQFFGESIYITPDDAGGPAGGNAWNNASYRSVTFNTGGPPFAMSIAPGSTTQRRTPALYAWKALDASVRIAGYDVPRDGRLLVGHSVTSNGNGTWHYEYAVLNLTSDRSGGEFAVPVPAGAIVTNAAFHGVASHSGEPFSSDPWIATVGGGEVRFAPAQGYADNPNANALRWGTMDNFRFDANVAPGEGNARLGLFKPPADPNGPQVASVLIGVRTPGGASLAPGTPVNDDCSGALPLHSGENRCSTFGATTSSPAACPGGNGASPVAMQNDVWFVYAYDSRTGGAGCPGSITIDTCGSDIDTSLAVYAGSLCPLIAGLEIGGTGAGCSDNGGACTVGAAGSSSVSFAATDGQSYLVRVGSPTGARGNIVVNVAAPFCVAPMGACCAVSGACEMVPGSASCFSGTFAGSGTTCSSGVCPQPPPPANDHCENATAIGDSALGYGALSGNNYSADLTVNDVCDFGASGQRDVWYVYVPTQTGPVAIDTCTTPATGVQMDTFLTVHEGSCTGPIVGCNDDAFGFCAPSSRTTPTLTAGTAYYIRVAGYGTTIGEFIVRVTGGGGTPRGACCWGSACVVSSPTGCVGSNRGFGGLNTACSPGPCCRPDFNHTAGLTVQDIFDYLTAWFNGSPSAAYGGNGFRSPTLQDVFDFLAGWFAGC